MSPTMLSIVAHPCAPFIHPGLKEEQSPWNDICEIDTKGVIFCATGGPDALVFSGIGWVAGL